MFLKNFRKIFPKMGKIFLMQFFKKIKERLYLTTYAGLQAKEILSRHKKCSSKIFVKIAKFFQTACSCNRFTKKSGGGIKRRCLLMNACAVKPRAIRSCLRKIS